MTDVSDVEELIRRRFLWLPNSSGGCAGGLAPNSTNQPPYSSTECKCSLTISSGKKRVHILAALINHSKSTHGDGHWDLRITVISPPRLGSDNVQDTMIPTKAYSVVGCHGTTEHGKFSDR